MTPIFDALMDEFYPEAIDVEIPSHLANWLRLHARMNGVPVEFLLQDLVMDKARWILAGAA